MDTKSLTVSQLKDLAFSMKTLLPGHQTVKVFEQSVTVFEQAVAALEKRKANPSQPKEGEVMVQIEPDQELGRIIKEMVEKSDENLTDWFDKAFKGSLGLLIAGLAIAITSLLGSVPKSVTRV